MNKLTVGDLLKSADRMKARLCEMEAEIADADRRLTRLEEEGEAFRFLAAVVVAPTAATCHRAPRATQ
jgi:hypothetical protein